MNLPPGVVYYITITNIFSSLCLHANQYIANRSGLRLSYLWGFGNENLRRGQWIQGFRPSMLVHHYYKLIYTTVPTNKPMHYNELWTYALTAMRLLWQRRFYVGISEFPFPPPVCPNLLAKNGATLPNLGWPVSLNQKLFWYTLK